VTHDFATEAVYELPLAYHVLFELHALPIASKQDSLVSFAKSTYINKLSVATIRMKYEVSNTKGFGRVTGYGYSVDITDVDSSFACMKRLISSSHEAGSIIFSSIKFGTFRFLSVYDQVPFLSWQ
jgi:hypothetical protein